MIMQAALSSVNFGLNPKPSWPKKSFDFFRSRTARLTKILRVEFVAMVVSSLIPFWVRSRTWLLRRAERKHRAQPLVAQPEASPEEERDVDGKEGLAEERVADAHMRRDGAAEIAGPQHGAEHRRARDQVDGQACELEQPEPEEDVRGVPELGRRLDGY